MDISHCLMQKRSYHPGTLNLAPKSSRINSNPFFLKKTSLQPPYNEYNNMIPIQRDPPRKSCKECLYTGIATCSCLSLYFLKLASEEPSNEATKQTKSKKMKPIRNHKYFCLCSSAAWAMAGVYRVYLG